MRYLGIGEQEYLHYTLLDGDAKQTTGSASSVLLQENRLCYIVIVYSAIQEVNNGSRISI